MTREPYYSPGDVYRIAYKPAGFPRRMLTVYDVRREIIDGVRWLLCVNALTELPLWLHEQSVLESWRTRRLRGTVAS